MNARTSAADGRIAVVTGASSGVGAAVAARLLRDGARVWLTARSCERLRAVAAAAGGEARIHAADLATEDGRDGLVDAVAAAEPRIDLLVHCAGIFTRGTIEEVAAAELEEQFRVNALAPYAITRGWLPLLRSAAGDVVFVNSTVGAAAAPGVGAYSASKHALRAIADTLRAEVNADGVRVLTVYLGRTATPMQERVSEREGRPYRPETLVQPEEVAAAVAALVGLPRTAEATELTLRPLRKPE